MTYEFPNEIPTQLPPHPLPSAAPAPTPDTQAAHLPAQPAPALIPAATPIIDIRGVTRVYETGRVQVQALAGVDVRVDEGEFVAIVGPSGSGKSTLMNVIGCLDRPTGGEYYLAGTSVGEMNDDGLAEIRSKRIGFVFQSFNLLPRTSALDNVAAPLMYQGVGARKRKQLATEALTRLGLGDRLDHDPTELSGGQQQRVAVARAIVTDPALILADEPTGNLDTKSGEDVMALFHELHDAGRTIVLITHEQEVAERASRQIHIRDGLVAA